MADQNETMLKFLIHCAKALSKFTEKHPYESAELIGLVGEALDVFVELNKPEVKKGDTNG